jgi:hypothetical protein
MGPFYVNTSYRRVVERNSTLTLALTTSRPTNHACLHRGDPLIWVLLPVELFDLSRLEESHGAAAAAVLAPAAAAAAARRVLADAAAAAVLALGALPPVLADATAAAVLALATLPPVLTDAATTAVLALGHWWRSRPCSQMPLPPQSLHLLRCRACSHFVLPITVKGEARVPGAQIDASSIGRAISSRFPQSAGF